MARFPGAPESWSRLWAAYLGVYDVLGGNPYMGRELVATLFRAGVQPRRACNISHGGCAGSPEFDAVADHFVGMISSARPHLTAFGLMSKTDSDAALADLRAWIRRPDAAFWIPFIWVEGLRPAS